MFLFTFLFSLSTHPPLFLAIISYFAWTQTELTADAYYTVISNDYSIYSLYATLKRINTDYKKSTTTRDTGFTQRQAFLDFVQTSWCDSAAMDCTPISLDDTTDPSSSSSISASSSATPVEEGESTTDQEQSSQTQPDQPSTTDSSETTTKTVQLKIMHTTDSLNL